MLSGKYYYYFLSATSGQCLSIWDYTLSGGPDDIGRPLDG